MDVFKKFASIKVDDVNDAYNRLTDSANCPICKKGVLSFVAAENDLMAVTTQTAHFIDNDGELDEVTYPTFTLICTNCGTEQTVNTSVILKAMLEQASNNEE